MKIEKMKKFVKEHKTEIIAGIVATVSVATLAVIGVKAHKATRIENWKEANQNFMNMLNAIDDASKDCTIYVPLSLGEVAAAIDKDGNVADCLRDPNGKLFEVKNLIAFGNLVES